jgi:hypothetical protein
MIEELKAAYPLYVSDECGLLRRMGSAGNKTSSKSRPAKETRSSRANERSPGTSRVTALENTLCACSRCNVKAYSCLRKITHCPSLGGPLRQVALEFSA